MPMKPIRNSAKAIIIRDGRILLIACEDLDGVWYSLPGGGQEPGETLHDAVRRECREEIAADVEVGGLMMMREYIGRNHEFAEKDGLTHQIEFMFSCSVEESYSPMVGALPDTHQIGIAWIALAELDRVRLYPMAVSRILAGGMPGPDPIYLGDVN